MTSNKSIILFIFVLICLISFNINDIKQIKTPSAAIQQTTTQPIKEKILNLKELPVPSNGVIKKYIKKRSIAPFKINASNYSNFFVKLIDTGTRKLVLAMFVRKGSVYKTRVPLGSYVLKYASGNKWYGEKNFFGSDTGFFETNDIFEFTRHGNKVSGYTVTLYEVPNGNLSTVQINKADF